MIRRIIRIDESRCDGCGLCASACHEGAIGLADGKARLLRDDYCDGLGDCLPACPSGAISFEEREALAYDEAAVKKKMENSAANILPCGCPGAHARQICRENAPPSKMAAGAGISRLGQWPVQIKLAPVNAAYFESADLLVSADCAAYAYANFHEDYMRGKITLIGCPKLNEGDYSEKLAEILKNNAVKSVTVVRMEVPCCGGIESAVRTALLNSGKMIPLKLATITCGGKILAGQAGCG